MSVDARGAPALRGRRGQDGWRRTADSGLGSAGLDPAFVESARLRLLQQRTFRLSQLDELAAWRPEVLRNPGQRELHTSLHAAARVALLEADAAIRRIERGTFGRCAGCGQLLPITRLRAVPSAPLCAPCHRECWS